MLDAVLVGVDPHRCLRSTAIADQTLEVAQPVQLLDQRPDRGITHSQVRHPREHAPGAVEITRPNLREPYGHIGLQGRVGGQGLELRIIRVLREELTRQRRCPHILAASQRVSEIALGGIPPVHRPDECNQNPNDDSPPPPAASRPVWVAPRPERSKLRQQQHDPTAPPTTNRWLFGGDRGSSRLTRHGGVFRRHSVAVHLEKRSRRRHELGFVTRQRLRHVGLAFRRRLPRHARVGAPPSPRVWAPRPWVGIPP